MGDIMQIRKVMLLYDELNDVEKIISNTSKLLDKNPNDSALQNDLLFFNNRKKELLAEIDYSKNELFVANPEIFNENRDIFNDLDEKILNSLKKDIGKEYILALLYANNKKSINGKIKLIKELFFIAKNIPSLLQEFEFHPYYNGPDSDVAEGYIDEMIQIGLINVNGSIFSLTDYGEKFVSENNLNNEIISEIKSFCDDLTDEELLILIYFSYPEMFYNSLIFNRILSNRIYIALSLLNKNKITYDEFKEISDLNH